MNKRKGKSVHQEITEYQFVVPRKDVVKSQIQSYQSKLDLFEDDSK